jgi:hypothetical protein
VRRVAQGFHWLRARSRWIKFGILMVATWPFVLLAAHPLAAFLIAAPAGGLFFIATKNVAEGPNGNASPPLESPDHERT